jgi:hypothetical protein
MKTLPLLAAIACLSAPCFAQGPAQPPPAPAAVKPVPGLSILTPDERSTLVTVTQEATDAPAVKAAIKKRHEAIVAEHAAMVAKDKSLGPIFEKIDAGISPNVLPPTLTDAQRAKLLAARAAMAGTPEEAAVQKAAADYREALHKAMIAEDPSIAPILDKMEGKPVPGASPQK